jgi:hypothetical protein
MRYAKLFFLSLVVTACGGSIGDSAVAKSTVESQRQTLSATASTKRKVKSNSTSPSAMILTSLDQTVEPALLGAFEIATAWGIEIDTRLAGLSAGSHAIEVVIVSPKGLVYERYNLAFEVAEGASTADVWHTLMVSGTAISDYNMVGTWTVNAYLDSASTAITSGSFDLK